MTGMFGSDGRNQFFSRLYFGVQSLRRGVDRPSIHFVRELLDANHDTLHRHVESRLTKMHGGTTPAIEWLEEQPVTDRSDLRKAMQVKIETAPRRLVEVRQTSGSTGAPFRFVKDRRMTAMMDAVMWAVYGWHGIEPGQKHARFWGMPRARLTRMRRRTMDLLLHRRRMDAFDLSAQSADRFFLQLRRFQPSYVHAYPSLVLEFANHCIEAGHDGRELGVETVVCGGELLPPSAREALREFFDARIVNEYGCSESGLISIDCEYGKPHLLPIAVYPQLVGAPRQSHETLSGEVVITDLYGTIMPLIRYRLHDRAEVEADPRCECGRSLPTLSPVVGRVDSFIQTPSKGRVYDAILAYTVPADVLQFRAYQIERGKLFVEVVLARQDSQAEALRELESTWQGELGPGMQVNAVAVDDIPRMESGKLAYFIPEGDVPASVLARAAG